MRVNPVSLLVVCCVGVVNIVFVCLSVVIGIRHLRGFWFSRELGGDQGEAGALAEGRPGVHGLGTVGRQHPAVLPDAACDGQTGLVPHGFSKCELQRQMKTQVGVGAGSDIGRQQIGVL